MPNPPSSPTDDDSPVPNSTRPLEMRSSVDTRSATRAGWLTAGGRCMIPKPEPNVLGALARRGEEDLRRGGVAVLLEEVVLGQPDRGEAGLVGGLHLVEAVLEQLVLVVVTPRPRQREFVEQRDLHLVTFRSESSAESVLAPPVAGSWSLMCLAAT